MSLELFLDGRLVDADHVEVSPEANRGVAFDLGAVESGVLRLKAATGDHLALDDVAYAIISPPRRGRVLLVTPGDDPLRLALQTKAAAEMADVRVESPGFLKTKPYAEQAAAGAWQLAIYDRCRPERMPESNTLWIGSLPPEGGWSAGKPVASPQIIDVVASHPLLQWIDLGDVLVAEGTPLRPPRGGSVLVDSDAGPLLALAPRDAFEDAVLGFVILDEAAEGGGPAKRYIGTNWFIRPSFPVFVLNLLEYLGGGRDVLETAGPRPGTPVVLDDGLGRRAGWQPVLPRCGSARPAARRSRRRPGRARSPSRTPANWGSTKCSPAERPCGGSPSTCSIRPRARSGRTWPRRSRLAT